MAKDARMAVPKLRFPEFRRAAAWEMKPLSALLDYERPEKYIVADVTYQNSGTPVLTANKSFILGYTPEVDGVYTGVPVVIFDDFTTDTKYVDFPFKVKSSAIKILKAKGDDSLKVIFELMGGIKFEPKEHKRYYISEYQNLEVAIPKAPEQQKIADCLTSLDEVIAAQGRKVEALKAHKRGLMQQLFPREGETRPHLRFPEFRDAPEWKDIAIGDMGDVITGSTPATSRKEYYGGDRHFVSPADISDLRFIESTKTTLSETGFAQCRQIRARSVLFVCIGSTIGKVAQNTHECATNQQINALVPSAEYSGDFAYYLLHFESERIAGLAGKQAVPIINKTLFSSVRVPVPRLDEQHRIADCLSSLDTQIAVESTQLAALKIHKQGLMQQLFPSPEGVVA